MPNEIINTKDWERLYKELLKKYEKQQKAATRAAQQAQVKKDLQKIRNQINYEKRKQKMFHEYAQIGATELNVSLYKKFEKFEMPNIKGTPKQQIRKNQAKYQKLFNFGSTLYSGYLNETITRLRARLNKVAASLEKDTTPPEDVEAKIAEWEIEINDLSAKAAKTRKIYYKQLFNEAINVYRDMIQELREILQFKQEQQDFYE